MQLFPRFFYNPAPKQRSFKMSVKLNITGVDDEITKKIKNELEDCNIKWINEPDANTIIFNIYIKNKFY